MSLACLGKCQLGEKAGLVDSFAGSASVLRLTKIRSFTGWLLENLGHSSPDPFPREAVSDKTSIAQ